MGSNTFQTKLLSVQRNLLNFAYALTSNRDDAFDLLQDTTLKALDSEDKYVEKMSISRAGFFQSCEIFLSINTARIHGR